MSRDVTSPRINISSGKVLDYFMTESIPEGILTLQQKSFASIFEYQSAIRMTLIVMSESQIIPGIPVKTDYIFRK